MQGSYFLGKKNLEIKKKNYDGSDMPIRHSLCHSSVQKRRRRKVFQYRAPEASFPVAQLAHLSNCQS